VADVLTPAAVAFVEDLQRRFGPRRDALLARRAVRRAEVARTGRLDFLAGTAAVRDGCRRHRPTSPTAGSRSLGRPTGRWPSTR
jgi:malate synthase